MQSGLATPLSAERAPSRLGRRARLARLGRAACVVFGIALAAYLVRGAGFARVADVVRDARAWLPVLVVLELLVIAADALAARTLVRGTSVATSPGAGGAPLSSWLRASALANACSVFLPAGRAAGEAARGATLSPSFGTSRVVAAFARLQVCSLLGTAIASFVLAALVALLATGSRALAPLLLGNALVCAALGGGIFLVVRSARLRGFARRVLAKLMPSTASAPSAPSAPSASAAAAGAMPPSLRASARAVALCTLGRAVQAVQYGVAVLAVGGAFTVASSVTAHGIHLVAASGGDLLPNQVGAMEAAYAYFAEPLGFADAPARALSIALVMHGIQVGVALFGLVLAGLLPRTQEATS